MHSSAKGHRFPCLDGVIMFGTCSSAGIKKCQRRLHGRGGSSGEARKRGAGGHDPDTAAAQGGCGRRPEARRRGGPHGADSADASAQRSAGPSSRGQAAAIRPADPQVRFVTQHMLHGIIGFVDVLLIAHHILHPPKRSVATDRCVCGSELMLFSKQPLLTTTRCVHCYCVHAPISPSQCCL